MFTRDLYEILHIVGIAMIFLTIGGVRCPAGWRYTARSSKRSIVAIHGRLAATSSAASACWKMGFQHGSAFPGIIGSHRGVLMSALAMLPYEAPPSPAVSAAEALLNGDG